MNSIIVIGFALLYLLLLFGVAFWAEQRRKIGKSVVNNGYVYALSLGVYCTAWTYYGSVGRASSNGFEFMAIYLGPTLAAAIFWPVLRKIIRICKTQRINSMADFISTRYGKNFSLAVMVTFLCILGVVPYIALQLKAIASSLKLLIGDTLVHVPLPDVFQDVSLYVTLIMALFVLLFSTRSPDASEKHEGLVAAVAFESIVKLLAFFVVGIFVVYVVFHGWTDLFQQAFQQPSIKDLLHFGHRTSYATWLGLMFVSLLAVLFLPRQFQVGVVENVQEKHLLKASWFFPLYMLLANVFVLPIALAGKLIFANSGVDADTYVLALPLHFQQHWLGLLVFLGGFSAATSMIIVETVALSTMISNNIATPLFLSAKRFKATSNGSFGKSIVLIRRSSIWVILGLAYFYNSTIAQHFSLVSLGLVSFVAVAQFAPAVIGGIYWKDASKNGAVAGISIGFVVWFFTLVIPSMVEAHWLSGDLMTKGCFGISWLKPFSLFGLEGMDSISHATFWSLLFNIIAFIVVSLNSKKSAQEIYQAALFIDVFQHSSSSTDKVAWKGTAYLPDLNALLETFLGTDRASKILSGYANRYRIPMDTRRADPRLVNFAEKVLAGVIGSASARIMVSSVTKEEELKIDEVLNMLRESQQLIELNKELKKKSLELQRATEQLTLANDQMKAIDTLKDEFLYTVTHELRTPLTSIRAMAEIVHDHTDMPDEQRQEFLANLIKETERLSHLITQVLNLERYESGRQKLHFSTVSLNDLIQEAIDSIQPIANENQILIECQIPNSMFLVRCDPDLMQQVLNNLLGNALKFVEPKTGKVKISVMTNHDEIQVWVEDNGKGIPAGLHEMVFDKFFQAKNQTLKKPQGSGLGLAISKKIVEMHQGRIWVESAENKGARFIFTMPNG